ncbi:MAG: hypothetical protein K6T34_00090 [Thermoflavifilum sp.]|nr:hypothetical protein [Thermoflavifilum sp.]
MASAEFYEEDWWKRLKEEAEQFEVPPAPGSWEVIESRLRWRRRRRAWLAAASWLLAIGIAGGLWWQYHRPSLSDKKIGLAPVAPSPAVTKHSSQIASPTNMVPPAAAFPSAHATPTSAASTSKPSLAPSSQPTMSHPYQAIPVVEQSSVAAVSARRRLISSPQLDLVPLYFPRYQMLNLTVDMKWAKLQLPPGWGMPTPMGSSQTDTSKTSRRLIFSISFAPGMGYRQLIQTQPATPGAALSRMSGPINNYIPSTALGHEPAFSYLGSVDMQTPFSRKWSIGTGLHVLNFQYAIRAVNLSGTSYARTVSYSTQANGAPAQLSTVYGAYNPNTLFTPDTYTRLVNQQVNVEWPLFVGYQGQISRKMSWQITGGAGIDFALHQQQYMYTTVYQRYESADQQLRKWNVSALVSGSLRIRVGDVLLFMGPDVHYQILNTYRHQPALQENLYMLSWKIGVIP